MARCKKCGSMMLLGSKTGYCKKCAEELIAQAESSKSSVTVSPNKKPELRIPQPIRKSSHLIPYTEVIFANQSFVDSCMRSDHTIRGLVDGRYCAITPAYHCYLFRDGESQDGFFILAAVLEIERKYTFMLCAEKNPDTGKLKMFWLGGEGKIESDPNPEDGFDMLSDLYYHLETLVPNWKAWIMDYISTER